MFENDKDNEKGLEADLSGLDVMVADTDGADSDDLWADEQLAGAESAESDVDWPSDFDDDSDLADAGDPPAAPDFDWDDDLDLVTPASASGVVPAVAATSSASGRKGGKHAAHASKPKSNREIKKEEKQRKIEEMPEHQRRSIRTRRVLIAVLVLILALAAAGGYFVYQMYLTSQQELGQQTNETDVDAVNAEGQDADESGRVTQKTQVPQLTSLFGMTQDEAVESIGHGATVTTTQDENEEGSAVKQRVTVELSEEPGDSKSGTPTVYLGLDKDGKVVMTGYSAATASLGYGTLSLQDIVENEHVIEHTLVDAGVIVEDGAATLPEDPAEYQVYDSDGTTLVRESANFDGEAEDAEGNAYQWSGVLAYDYTAANASGNLADTVRQVYIYIERG